MQLTTAAYAMFLEAIARSTAIDELAALRKEIRLQGVGDERVNYLEQLIDARANQLMDLFNDDGTEE